MEIVTNPTVKEAARTMATDGPLSVSLAVITLLRRVAVSGAEIAKAQRMPGTLGAAHGSACTDERSDGYQRRSCL